MDNFFQIDNSLIDMLPKIGHAGFIVYSVLKRHMNNDSRQCFPSQESLADICMYDKRQVVRAIKKLEAHGMVTVQRRARKPNVYFLNEKSLWIKNVREYDDPPIFTRFPLPDSYYEACIGEQVELPPVPDYISYIHVNFDSGDIFEMQERYVA